MFVCKMYHLLRSKVYQQSYLFVDFVAGTLPTKLSVQFVCRRIASMEA